MAARSTISAPGSRLGHVLCQLRGIALRGEAVSDGELLERFITDRDEDAFAALVARHGPMVLACARRVAGNVHDAEDAFQATFLVLARKADSVQPRAQVGHWLYGVAYHAAQKARAAALRRHAREKQVSDMPHPTFEPRESLADLGPLLDQELCRLGEKHRLPLILCDLEGRGRSDVARELGIPEGTLSSRLTHARRALAARLTRRGVTLSAGALAFALSERAAPAVPPLLAASTVRAAVRYSAGEAVTSLVALPVAALTQGVLKTMALSKVKLALLACLAVGLLFVHTTVDGVYAPLARADSASPAAADKAAPSLQPAWADLSGTDDTKVARALLTLGATPKETMAFLKDNLFPVKADARRVEKLIADLDSDKHPIREAAAEQLEYLGKYVKADLEKAAAESKSVEVKRRVRQLLDRLPQTEKKDPAVGAPGKPGAQNVQVQNINGQIRIVVNGVQIDPNAAPAKAAPAGPSPMWIRATRAIAVLEHIGTPEAKQLLEAIAAGEADALPTQQAKAALMRLKK